MKRILVTGACGQIGTELTHELRKKYGKEQVVAADIKTNPGENIKNAGPYEIMDCTNYASSKKIVEKYNIDTIFHLAAILSAKAEADPNKAWEVNINGLYNILEIAREKNCSLFTPSSIGAFGPSTPSHNTPQDTVQRPDTMYGITKVTGELLCDYYHKKYNIDTRGVRYPGLISHKQLPGGGTTDYAVEIFYEAIRHKKYVSPLQRSTYLDMMYMPDAIKAAIQLMEADGSKLEHRNAFNVTSFSADPEMLGNAIKEQMPDFELYYEIDPEKQNIADSWPDNLNDSAASQEWGWFPDYNIKSAAKDMLEKLSKKIQKETA